MTATAQRATNSIMKSKRLWITRLLIGLGLIGFITLEVMGYLQPVEAKLDAAPFEVNIGEATLSFYAIMKGLFVAVMALWLAAEISALIGRIINKFDSIRSSNRALIAKGIQIFIYFITFLVVMDVLGIDLTALTVLSGAIGIGIGFGLQKITSNFISGLILLMEKSIEEGDLIELDDNTYGFIRRTGARYTLIETINGKEILIPNEDFITSRVTNWTFSNTKGRVDITLGVSYNSDLELVQSLILEAAHEHPLCLQDPKAECFLTDYGDSSVDFLLYFWIDDVLAGRMRPKSEVMMAIWKKFKEHNIEIPFPQRDVHIRSGGPIGS